MKRFIPASLAIASALLASGSPGIRPRASIADYPVHATSPEAAFGAAIIPSNEAKKIFGADMSPYIVVEAGIFPASGRDADISPLDFTLLADPSSISERPADADAVVAVVTNDTGKEARNSTDVFTTAGVGVAHESYPDPVTGARRGATMVGTNAGVGVGSPAGPQFPDPGTGARRSRLEQLLWEKSLPDGKTPQPVAGYLYFPKPSKKVKDVAWVLRWDAPSGRVNITLPDTTKH